MQALEKLGLKLSEPISLDELLSENFNPQLYSLTRSQEEKISALRDVVAAYITCREDITGKIVKGSKEAAEIAGEKLRRLEHEEFWVLYLNRANMAISFEMLFKGCLDAVNISHRDVIAKALSKNSSTIIVFHNHPSGCPTPGTSDIEMTRQLQKACKLMEITLLDHIIVSPGSYYSFADEMTTKFKIR